MSSKVKLDKKRILGIVIPVAVALVYFYFNPLAPRVFESKEKVEAQAQQEAAAAEEEIPPAVAVLLESDVEAFIANYPAIKAGLSNYQMAETPNPAYEDVAEYTKNAGTFDSINQFLAENGLNSQEPLKRYFAISNCYGIASYDRMLKSNPMQARIIKKMASETIEPLRKTVADADLDLVNDYFAELDEVLRANSTKGKK